MSKIIRFMQTHNPVPYMMVTIFVLVTILLLMIVAVVVKL